MRKSVLFIAIAALVSLASLASEARAQQWQPFDGKLLVHVNIGLQAGDHDVTRQSTFELYDEIATIDISQTIDNGGFFEFGGAYKVRGNLGVGLTFGFLGNSGEGRVSGSLPHPQFFDQPRSFSADATNLDHSERSVHFQAIYFMPFTDKVDFAFSAGPSLFSVKQGLVRNVSFSEIPPAFTSVTIDSIDAPEITDSGWGINLGADMTYALTPRIGVGALLRYTHGNIEFNLSDTQRTDIGAGGFQIGGGLRVRF
jgi:opacity protein-like surface antigen